MIFSIYNGHVVVFNNCELKHTFIQTFNRPTDWFRNPAGFYLNLTFEQMGRSFYNYPPPCANDKNVWNTALDDISPTPPVAVMVSRHGRVYGVFKVGKTTITTMISDLEYGQNALVGSDISTVYADPYIELRHGDINYIEDYIRALQDISSSSTQGLYVAHAWYCTIEDFQKCLEESEVCNFDNIADRWKKVDFSKDINIQPLNVHDLPAFNYLNFAGFEEKKEDENV